MQGEKAIIQLRNGETFTLDAHDVKSIQVVKQGQQPVRYQQPQQQIQHYQSTQPVYRQPQSSGYNWMTAAFVIGVGSVILIFAGCAFVTAFAGLISAVQPPAPQPNNTTIIKIF